METSTTKTCCVCNVDVSHQQRTKDAKGHYYCEPCRVSLAEKRSQTPHAAGVVAVAESPRRPASPTPAPTIEPPSQAETEPTDTKPCPFCGESIKASAVKCRFCNEMVNGKSGLGPKTGTRSKSRLLIVASIAVLVIAVVAAFQIYRNLPNLQEKQAGKQQTKAAEPKDVTVTRVCFESSSWNLLIGLPCSF